MYGSQRHVVFASRNGVVESQVREDRFARRFNAAIMDDRMGEAYLHGLRRGAIVAITKFIQTYERWRDGL
jgi:hypothetical protein